MQVDVFAYGFAISACRGQWPQAVSLLGEAVARRLLSVVACNAAANACGKSSQWRQALAIFESISAHAMQPSVVSLNSLVACLPWQLSLCLLGSAQPDLVTYNSLIKGLGTWQLALVCLTDLESKQLQPDQITCSSLLSRCGSSWQSALRLLGDAR
ncbi:unnamed protein product, partial [Effrenium voratum]